MVIVTVFDKDEGVDDNMEDDYNLTNLIGEGVNEQDFEPDEEEIIDCSVDFRCKMLSEANRKLGKFKGEIIEILKDTSLNDVTKLIEIEEKINPISKEIPQ